MVSSAFPFSIAPLNNIQPFTYRAGMSHMAILEKLRVYINDTLRPEFNEEMGRILEEFQDGIENAETTVTDALTTWLNNFEEWSADVEGQIALLNDGAIEGLIEDLDSQTSNALDARYALSSFLTSELAALTAAVNSTIEDWQTDNDAIIATVKADQADNGYLVATFTGNGVAGERLSLFYSPDGKTVFGGDRSAAYTPVDGQGVRDPSMIFHDGKWFVTHTSNNGIDKDIQIAVSDTGAPGTWSLLTVLYGGSISSMWRMWAPEFVVDGDDVYIFFSSITDSDPDVGAMYWIKAANTQLTAWSAPVAMVFPTAPAHWIDGAFVKHSNQWYMFYSTGDDIGRAVAPTLTGTYVNDRSGDWAGWGTGIEGPAIVKEGDTYRAYFDRFVAGTGYWWSESTDLNTWSAPVQLKTAPGVLKPGQTIRHGSFTKLPTKAAANLAIAGQAMSPTARHIEIVSDPGFTAGNAVAATVTGWATDLNETTDGSIISSDAATGIITLNELGVYDFVLNTTATDVTGVTRSFAEVVSVDGPETIHLRNGCGAEDVFGVALPGFKAKTAGERIKFRVFAAWSGPETPAQYPTRLRITLR